MDQPDKTVDAQHQNRDIDRMKQMMWHCENSPYALRRDTSVSDGLNGNLRLKERDFAAAAVEAGDTIRVLVERADDDSQTIEFIAQIYADGRGFNLPIDYRRKLNLDHGDAVHYWIERVDRPGGAGDEDESSQDEAGENREQHTLYGDPVMEEPYVLIEDGNLVYHHLQEGGETTRCGINLGDDIEYRTFSDPGDVPLEECPDCVIRDSENMTNEELARWIAKELGFEVGGGPPSYFNKSQLVVLRDFILEANEAMADEDPDEMGADEETDEAIADGDE